MSGEPAVLELAHRVSGGIEVTLFWSPVDDSTAVEVWDARSEERLVFGVRAEDALDAFYHPFAQLAASFGELAPVADA
jgi:phosphoribosylformylglycinamidine (FGAM) synthase-like enzyme